MSLKAGKRASGHIAFRYRSLSPAIARPHASQHGFTLLELIIYLGIVSLVLVTATLFAYEFVATQAKGAAMQEVNRNARYAIDRIGIEIREAAELNEGASVFGSSPGTLSLGTTSGGTNPTVFTLSDGTLYAQRGAGAVLPITNSRVDVTEFLLENLSTSGKTKAIRVRITLRSRSDLQETTAETVVETTAKIKKNDGFSD